MLTEAQTKTMLAAGGRVITHAIAGDPDLDVFTLLPGKWSNKPLGTPGLPGRGWNMIALPFKGNAPFNFRLLLNQYEEELTFDIVDKGVPNRGIDQTTNPVTETDQKLIALEYKQHIVQLDGVDFPASGLVAPNGSAIHHEPGLWLHLGQPFDNGINVIRMGTIPHGDALNAFGKGKTSPGGPNIPDISGLPIGDAPVPDVNLPYFAAYKHFAGAAAFKGIFDPVHPNGPLKLANQGVTILETTEIHVDTTTSVLVNGKPVTGGIVNIPFVVKQANPTEMQFTMWIQKLAEKDAAGNNRLRLQYSQTVFLEFFARHDGKPGLIRWPHVSVNTLEKVV